MTTLELLQSEIDRLNNKDKFLAIIEIIKGLQLEEAEIILRLSLRYSHATSYLK